MENIQFNWKLPIIFIYTFLGEWMRDWTGGFIADGLTNERLTNTDCAKPMQNGWIVQR